MVAQLLNDIHSRFWGPKTIISVFFFFLELLLDKTLNYQSDNRRHEEILCDRFNSIILII